MDKDDMKGAVVSHLSLDEMLDSGWDLGADLRDDLVGNDIELSSSAEATVSDARHELWDVLGWLSVAIGGDDEGDIGGDLIGDIGEALNEALCLRNQIRAEKLRAVGAILPEQYMLDDDSSEDDEPVVGVVGVVEDGEPDMQLDELDLPDHDSNAAMHGDEMHHDLMRGTQAMEPEMADYVEQAREQLLCLLGLITSCVPPSPTDAHAEHAHTAAKTAVVLRNIIRSQFLKSEGKEIPAAFDRLEGTVH